MREVKYWNAIVLALIAGVFGIQEFYIKRPVFGILGILFFWTGIPALVAYIEAIMWLCTSKEDFEKEFNNFYESQHNPLF